MQGFSRTKQGILSIFGILFVFLPLFGLFVLRFLKGFLLICYNLIGQRRVTRVSTFLFLHFLIFDFLQSCFSLMGGFLILLLYLLFINIFLCRFLSKKKKKILYMTLSVICKPFSLFQKRDDARQFMRFLHPNLGVGIAFQSAKLLISPISC